LLPELVARLIWATTGQQIYAKKEGWATKKRKNNLLKQRKTIS
jgi:hypothetical protein